MNEESRGIVINTANNLAKFSDAELLREFNDRLIMAKELSQTRKLIAELVKAAEDFELRENHAEWCLIKKQYGGGCNCMDTKAYSLHECSTRIREVLSNNKDLIEKLTKE